MPSANIIQFSTASLANTIKKGQAILGVNDAGYGPTTTTGFWNGITPPSGGYTIYVSRSIAGPNIYTPSSDSELITYASKLTNVPFTSVSGTLAWFATQSNSIVVNKNYPNIVVSSSNLILDASFIPSYPTTASTWYDLSGNNYTSSLTNGPIFNSRGYFNFDGTDDYVAIPNELALTLNGNPGATLEMVLLLKKRDNSSGQSGLTQLSGFNNTNGNLYFYANFGDGTGGLFLDVFRNSRVTIPTSSLSSKTVNPLQWHQLNITTTPGANGWKVYWNGELKYSDTGLSQVFVSSSTYTPSFSSSIGDLTFGKSSGTRELSGSIASYKLYNRTLSQSEILQNYYQGSIVTDGLVFAVDAGNLVSYESGSLSTYSLTGSFTGSLDNGTSFSNINGGTFVFDGVDDFINVPINAAFNTPSVTFEVWANLQSINDRHIIYVNWQGNSLEVNSDRSVTMFNFNSAGQQGAQTAGGVIEWGTWNHFVGTYNSGSQTLNTYVNGILLATRANTLATIYSVSVHKISGTNFGGEVKGNISIVRHYNRALSTQEISQNFQAQRSRFGI